MLDNSSPRFVENVRNPGANIREQTDGVPEEVCRTKNAIELPQHLLPIMEEYSAFKIRNSESSVLKPKSIEFQSSIAEIPKCHCQDV